MPELRPALRVSRFYSVMKNALVVVHIARQCSRTSPGTRAVRANSMPPNTHEDAGWLGVILAHRSRTADIASDDDRDDRRERCDQQGVQIRHDADDEAFEQPRAGDTHPQQNDHRSSPACAAPDTE